MARKPDWDFALRIRGVTLKSLPVAALADYLKELAALLGEHARPMLDGIVKGSVIVRVKQAGEHPAYTKGRLQSAANDPTCPGGRSFRKISELMRRDGARGEIVDRSQNVVVLFDGTQNKPDESDEVVIHDVGSLDGKVVGVSGADDTVHLRLQDRHGNEHKITIRDLSIARELASRFRGVDVRVHVHGTWKRTTAGKWEVLQVYADRIEDLDDSSVKAVFDQLRQIKTGWSDIADPEKEWADIRGINELHA